MKVRKSQWIKILCIVCVVLLMAAIILFFIPKQNGSFHIDAVTGYFTAKSYLDNIISEKYDKAIKNVYLYEGSVDNPSSKKTEDVLSQWQQRIIDAKERLDYLDSYSNLQVFLKDGRLVGTVSLTEYVSGVSQTYDTELVFVSGKIADITTSSIKDDIEQNLSGNIE